MGRGLRFHRGVLWWRRTLVALSFAPLAMAAGGEVITWLEPLTQMAFARVEAGCFKMGNPDALEEYQGNDLRRLGFERPVAGDEAPVHDVCLDQYWIGRHEVTVGVWRRLMFREPTEAGPELPVTGITWHEATAFVTKLTDRHGGDYRFRLPTEAEWEYACLAGTADLTRDDERRVVAAFAHDGDNVAPLAVGSRLPNAWQLHDMLGNVWEWTRDGYREDGYRWHPMHNPETTVTTDHVIRGGSIHSSGREIRCRNRAFYPADDGMNHIGFRVVRVEASR